MIKGPAPPAIRDRAAAIWQRRAVWDAGLAALLTAAAFTPQIADNGVAFAELPVHPGGAAAVAATLAQCLPLAVRRRWPAACLTVVACGFAAAQSLAYPPSFAGVGLLVALYSAGAYLARFRYTTAAAGTVGYAALALGVHRLRSPERPVDYVTFYVVLLACWGAGAWTRARQAGEAERSRENAQRAIERERARIARDLHDVVTHHVTAMVVQADAAQFLLPGDPDRATGNLAAIGDTGRRALADLRDLLGLLDVREPGQPGGPGERAAGLGPGLALGELVARTRQAGQPVGFAEDGERAAVTAEAGLVAYRVVQESLTNAVRHAPGRPTEVHVSYGPDIEVEVITDGPVIEAGDFAPGRGLTGLEERVRAAGGTLTAGGGPGGGFRVHARIPARTAVA